MQWHIIMELIALSVWKLNRCVTSEHPKIEKCAHILIYLMSMFSQYKYHIISTIFIMYSFLISESSIRMGARHRLTLYRRHRASLLLFSSFSCAAASSFFSFRFQQISWLPNCTCTNKREQKRTRTFAIFALGCLKWLHKIHMTEINFINLFESNCLKIQTPRKLRKRGGTREFVCRNRSSVSDREKNTTNRKGC